MCSDSDELSEVKVGTQVFSVTLMMNVATFARITNQSIDIDQQIIDFINPIIVKVVTGVFNDADHEYDRVLPESKLVFRLASDTQILFLEKWQLPTRVLGHRWTSTGSQRFQ